MKQQFKHVALALGLTTAIAACHSGPTSSFTDTETSGTIHISVDETYKPLIDSEIRVFESLYPKAHIIADYKPEQDCFADLLADSTRMIIVTRELSEKETQFIKDQKDHIVPSGLRLAWDAVALVVNKQAKDSIFNMDQLRDIMSGKDSSWQLVFDNEKSSTVRYIRDSINQGKPLPAGTMAAKTNPEVIDYVVKNKKAMGLIGVSWISDTADSTSIDFTNRVNVVKLRADGYTEYVQPYQYYIGTGAYPLKRSLWYNLKEPHQGLGTGFATFLGSQEGQLLIGRFKLFPARMNILFKTVNLK